MISFIAEFICDLGTIILYENVLLSEMGNAFVCVFEVMISSFYFALD